MQTNPPSGHQTRSLPSPNPPSPLRRKLSYAQRSKTTYAAIAFCEKGRLSLAPTLIAQTPCAIALNERSPTSFSPARTTQIPTRGRLQKSARLTCVLATSRRTRFTHPNRALLILLTSVPSWNSHAFHPSPMLNPLPSSTCHPTTSLFLCLLPTLILFPLLNHPQPSPGHLLIECKRPCRNNITGSTPFPTPFVTPSAAPSQPHL